MPSPESEDETRPAPEAPAAASAGSDEPAWPPAEARPEETSPPPAELAPSTATTATTATDEPVQSKPEELPPATSDEQLVAEPELPPAKSDEQLAANPEELPPATSDEQHAAEPNQEMGLSESTLHWMVDGEHAVEPVAHDPGTAPHYDSRALVAGRRRTVLVIGSAAVVAFVVAVALHSQAARNRAAVNAPSSPTAEPAAVLTQRADAALAQGREGEALDLANLALGSDPRFSEAYIVVGKVQRDTGRLPASRDAYRKYLELAPLGTHAEEARAALATLPP